MFHAVHLGMLSCCPQSALSTHDLRSLVAGSIFQSFKDPDTRQVLVEWRDILVQAKQAPDRDDDLIREFRHALPLLASNHSETNVGSLCAVYHCMCDKNRYWGDGYALLVLQQMLGIHMIVLGEPGFIQPPVRRPEPDQFCVLLINEGNAHYRVGVTRDGERRVAAFRWSNVPSFIRRHCENRWSRANVTSFALQ
jgi:hypothetical protein